jgi:hypothetical protein
MSIWTQTGLEQPDDVATWVPDHRERSPREQIEDIRDEVNHLTQLVDHLHNRPALYSHDIGGVAIDLILLLDRLGAAFGYDLLGQLEDERSATAADDASD